MKRASLIAFIIACFTLYCQGQSCRLFPTKSMDAWGYVDARGMEVIPSRFDSAGVFFGNRAVVKLGGKYGFVDCRGAMVIAPKWEQLKNEFQRGFAMLHTNGYNEVIDSNGVVVFRSQGEVFLDEGGICHHQIGKKKWGLFDCNTKKATGEVKCSHILGFSEGMSAFTYKGRHGYINQYGEVVIPPVYQGARSFHEGKAAVCTAKEGWKYIDATGKSVAEARFDQATDFRGGYAAVVPKHAERHCSDTIWGVESQGKMVVTIDAYTIPMWSLIDSNGTLVEGIGHDMIYAPVNGIFAACDKGLCQAISLRTGLPIISVAYRGLIAMTEAYIVCQDDQLRKVDVYDYNGQMIGSVEGVMGLDVSYWGVIRASSDCKYQDLKYGIRPCSFQYFTGEKWVP